MPGEQFVISNVHAVHACVWNGQLLFQAVVTTDALQCDESAARKCLATVLRIIEEEVCAGNKVVFQRYNAHFNAVNRCCLMELATGKFTIW